MYHDVVVAPQLTDFCTSSSLYKMDDTLYTHVTDVPSPDTFIKDLLFEDGIQGSFNASRTSLKDLHPYRSDSVSIEVSSSSQGSNSTESSDTSESISPTTTLFLPNSEYLSSPGEQNSQGSTPSSSSPEKSSSLKYPPCEVCSGKSSGLHYGCYTCEACKNFFRRYLLRNEGFHCKKSGNCPIINQSRGNCAGCRLQKCLSVGMSKERSKIGRYTHAQRSETIREVNKLEGKPVDDSTYVYRTYEKCPDSYLNGNIGKIKVEPEETLEIDQSGFGLIDTLVEAMDAIEHFGPEGKTQEGRLRIIEKHYEKYLAMVKLFGPLNAIPKEEFFTLLKMHNIDLGDSWNKFKTVGNNCQPVVQRYCEFAFQIPGFKELSQNDQGNLLKYGHCEFFIILMHEGYVDEYKIFLEMNGVPSHCEEAADKIFSRELIELQCELFMKWQKLNLQKAEIALLIAMSLVCSERCDLEAPEKVSHIHSMLMDILLNYLKLHYGSDGYKRFAKFIDCITFCRLGSEMYFREYKELSNNQMITEAVPDFPALCPDG